MPAIHATKYFAPVLIVAGPTASGKSALALDLAEAFDGVVINADSMQVYKELRVLSARPDEGEMRVHRTGFMACCPGARPARPANGVKWQWPKSLTVMPRANCRLSRVERACI